jgi:hypothetical protein
VRADVGEVAQLVDGRAFDVTELNVARHVIGERLHVPSLNGWAGFGRLRFQRGRSRGRQMTASISSAGERRAGGNHDQAERRYPDPPQQLGSPSSTGRRGEPSSS